MRKSRTGNLVPWKELSKDNDMSGKMATLGWKRTPTTLSLVNLGGEWGRGDNLRHQGEPEDRRCKWHEL